MKTKDFLVEYEGIGDDAQAMHVENEVQECRQKCYQAAKHAIKLHKMLHDVADTHDLEDWVLEKLSEASDLLKEVSEHMEYESYAEDEFELSQPDFDQSFDDHFPADDTLLSLGENNPIPAMRDINDRLYNNAKTFKNKGADAARPDLMQITKDRTGKHGASFAKQSPFQLEENEFEYSNMDPKDVYADLGRKMMAVNKIFASASDQQTKMAARKSLVQLSQRRERARQEMEASKAGNAARGSNELSLQAMAGSTLPKRGFTESTDAAEKNYKKYSKHMGKTPGETSTNLVKKGGKFYPNVDALSLQLHKHKKTKVAEGNPLPRTRGFTSEGKKVPHCNHEVVYVKTNGETTFGVVVASSQADAKAKAKERFKDLKTIKSVRSTGRGDTMKEARRTNVGKTLARKVDAIEKRQGREPTPPVVMPIKSYKDGVAQYREPPKTSKKKGMLEARSIPGSPEWDESVAKGKEIVKKYKGKYSDKRIVDDLLWNSCQNVPERVWDQFVEAVFAVDEDAASDDRQMKAGMNDAPAQRPALAPASRSTQQAAVKKANQSAPDSLDFTEDTTQQTFHIGIECGPTAADCQTIKIKAASEEEALAKAAKWAKKQNLRSPMITMQGCEANEGIMQGIKKAGKYVKRGAQGWGGPVASTPKDLRSKSSKGTDSEITSMNNFTKGAPKNSPAGVQRRAGKLELAKRKRIPDPAMSPEHIANEDATGGASCSGAVAAVVSPLGARKAQKVKPTTRAFKNSIKSPKVKMGKGIY